MNVTGVIAEYNPFHNGHAYQLTEAKRQTNADYLIVAMSGDFLQRGVPAIVDKHTRAEMALHAGADLVLELPVPCATGSAEYFADGGVRLLAATGAVTHICFGMETPDSSLLTEVASFLTTPPASLDSRISDLVRGGYSYPKARGEALAESLPHLPADQLRAFLAEPNNILALEYKKAILRYNKANPHQLAELGIRRVGSGYHEDYLRSGYASATAIRKSLFTAPTEAASADPFSFLSPVLPEHSLALLTEAAKMRLLLCEDDFSEALLTRLLFHRDSGYTEFADCTDTLSNRIRENLGGYISFSQFAALIKTRDVTRTRINRVLTHILLDIRREAYTPTPSYFRVLGFTRRAKPLLSEISKKASAPLITKVADAPRSLSDPAAKAFAMDIRAAELYRGISRIKSGRPLSNEYNTAIIIPE